jgi:uncharacterized protein
MREFWTVPLAELTPHEWESLCDRCAKCCYVYVHPEDSTDGTFGRSTKPCRLLNEEKRRCRGYSGRLWDVDGRDGYACQPITVKLVEGGTLPETCAYVRRHKSETLESWQIERAIKSHGNSG